MSDNPVMRAVGKIAAANRKVTTRADGSKTQVHVPDGVLEEARRELQVARLERAIRREIEPTDPGYVPLPEEERKNLASLLMGYRVRKA